MRAAPTISRWAWPVRRVVVGSLCVAWLICRAAAEVPLPPAPAYHFTDKAGIVSDAVAQELDRKLAQFERDTSNQFVVWIAQHVPDNTTTEQLAPKLFQAWRIGQKGKNNGVLLLVFVADHKMRLETNYGLEGALPDALCGLIIRNEIAPRFKQNDYAGGLSAGIDAVILASRGEYKGTGRTLAETKGSGGFDWGALLPVAGFLLFIAIQIYLSTKFRKRSRFYGPGGVIFYGGNLGGGGGGGSSGGGGSWGGGGFSGGGGSGSGGGGASGSW